MNSANDNSDDEDVSQAYSSPPCMMHLVDPLSGQVLPEADFRQQLDLKRWRKAERERLIALRVAIPAEERRRHSARIVEELDKVLGDISGRIVGVYWPFRGEPDLRSWMEGLGDRGAVCVLPVVVGPQMPLAFRVWRRGDALEPGVWNIPVPVEQQEATPDIVISPVVGFDRACYRLGNGGGFYDRTLAALPRRPRIIGVGYEKLAIPTIYPQPHDIAMDMIVTESGTLAG
ncbi:5-formyltetrahydrofolate cyclo-ligase [Reyranella massiliensis]|uniref:5-formyltetrahydrofolate cyclo-ligase n=1 Tax=Reyranella massiliensis TaxID=445220 RepID=UPI0002D4E9F6|nr:5-formyltetrahydrofolate cyclo-ligase [Reyranella massiliensis]